MTPQHKLKHIILTIFVYWRELPLPAFEAAAIDAAWQAALDEYEDELQDARNEVRCSGIETGLPSPSSRHYEAEEVAREAFDGSWVGWTYWHGGGKHGEPEAIDWIEDAYALTCTEEEKLVIVRTFAKAE